MVPLLLCVCTHRFIHSNGFSSQDLKNYTEEEHVAKWPWGHIETLTELVVFPWKSVKLESVRTQTLGPSDQMTWDDPHVKKCNKNILNKKDLNNFNLEGTNLQRQV